MFKKKAVRTDFESELQAYLTKNLPSRLYDLYYENYLNLRKNRNKQVNGLSGKEHYLEEK